MIQIRNLHKTFEGRPVLRGVDLDIPSRQLVAVVGPSGTGKSVLLKHIVGLLAPDAGDVLVDGVSVARASRQELAKLRRRMGYVFQDAALLDSLTIFENLRLALDDDLCDCDPGYCPRRIDAALATVNLDAAILGRRPGEVSGGMRKRVGVARALMSEPDFILYDEPTTGLDPRNVAQITDVMIRAREACNATSIMVTHDLEMVVPVTDRVVLLTDGRVRFDGTPRDFFASDDPAILGFRGVRGIGAEAA